MEPQEPKNARNANAHSPRPVKGIGGDGAAQVRTTKDATVVLEVRRTERADIEMYPGAALKLAEQIIHAARQALIRMATEAEGKLRELQTPAPTKGAA